MAFELLPGDECLIAKDYLVDGKLAFQRGELVKIINIDPDPERPGCKYLVQSERLGKEIRLPGHCIDRLNCKECGKRLRMGDIKCANCGWVVPERESELTEEELQEFRTKLFYSRRSSSGWYGPYF